MKKFPDGATHFMEFYGTITFYRTFTYEYLNQVSEEWQKIRVWEEFDGSAFVPVGYGFSDRTIKPISQYV